MNKKMLWLTVAVVIMSGPNVLAQETLIEHLVDACNSDIQNYCNQVTPGNGRLLYCMAAHEDKISGQCLYAFYQTAELLEHLAVTVNYLFQECGADIQTLCSDVAVGEGRLLACLEVNEEQVGDSCKKAIADTITK